MKATIDVPEVLYRRVKAQAALGGRAVREVTIELYERWLADQAPAPEQSSGQPGSPEQPAAGPGAPMTGADWLARWEELGAETARKAIDPRPVGEIVLSERR